MKYNTIYTLYRFIKVMASINKINRSKHKLALYSVKPQRGMQGGRGVDFIMHSNLKKSQKIIDFQETRSMLCMQLLTLPNCNENNFSFLSKTGDKWKKVWYNKNKDFKKYKVFSFSSREALLIPSMVFVGYRCIYSKPSKLAAYYLLIPHPLSTTVKYIAS